MRTWSIISINASFALISFSNKWDTPLNVVTSFLWLIVKFRPLRVGTLVSFAKSLAV